MQYAIRHISQFEYDKPIRESLMEVRVCPRTEAQQQRYSHDLTVTPQARIFSYQDFMGNLVHHFDVPGEHQSLLIESHAVVEVHPPPPLPDALPKSAWHELTDTLHAGDQLEMILPSRYTRPTPLLRALAEELGIVRRDDPLSLLRELNEDLYRSFEYSPRSTHANSPIDDALRTRSGVCQDFAHIFIALLRDMHIPSRYVSGYLFHRPTDQSDRSAEDGSHAWVEALLPGLGWVGFDPTNNVIAGERHIRVAIGRDYADIPPTRGMYKGDARSTLFVGVHVSQSNFLVPDEPMPALARVTQGEGFDTLGPLEAQQ
jgi:transglutaminase-like putative cysteine protease